MDTFQITDDLRIDKDPRGAMVCYIATTGDDADAFNVGLAKKSLQACQKTLTRNTASWEINDGSFRVTKADGKVTLIFKLQGPPYGSKELVLTSFPGLRRRSPPSQLDDFPSPKIFAGGLEIRAALAAVYGTFTEGFTTPDLMDAAAQPNSLA